MTSSAQFFHHHSQRIVPSFVTGCWHWTGAMTNTGYGEVKVSGTRCLAHRAAYEAINGHIPDGMVVRHRCDRPSCVNPGHLLIGTQAENVEDMTARQRQSRGAQRPLAKLSDADIAEIRTLLDEGVSQREIASRFGVSQPKISKIKNNKSWSHIQ